MKFKWPIRASEHNRRMRELETDMRVHHDVEMATLIRDFEIRRSKLRLQFNVLESYTTETKANLLERIQQLQDQVEALERYISDQALDRNDMPIAR